MISKNWALLLVLNLAFSNPVLSDAIEDCLNQVPGPNPGPGPGPSPTPPLMTYTLASPTDLGPRCHEVGQLQAVKQALAYQLQNCLHDKTNSQNFQIACRDFSRDEWCQEPIQQMLDMANSASDFSDFLSQVRSGLDWYKSSGFANSSSDGRFSAGETQVTGYYTPLIKASRSKQGSYIYPLYSKPPDLVRAPSKPDEGCGYSWCLLNKDGSLSPFYTHQQIDHGALIGRGLEIAYLQDPIECEFIMVQGSVSLQMQNQDGSPDIVRLSYAGQNGRKSALIGKILKCAGVSKQIYSSMNGIKKYLHQHPNLIQKYLEYDQSYIFFAADPRGHVGEEGVPVTPLHSIAVDRKQVPMGIPVLLDILEPTNVNGKTCSLVSSMAIAQDTGGAIRGAHIDWYQGTGDQAGIQASALNNPGWFFVGTKKGAGKPIPGCENQRP